MRFTDCISIVGESPKPYIGTKKYVSTGAVDTYIIDENKVEYVTFNERPSRANLVGQPNDVLFAKMAETKKTLILDEITADNIYSTGFFAIRAIQDLIVPECLYYLVSSNLFLTQKERNSSGATQRAITNKGLAAIEISLPSLEKQKQLVLKLNAISKIIDIRKKQLTELDTLIKARFIELFGDPDENPMKWETTELDQHLDIVGGFAFKSDGFADTGIPVLRIGNINSGHFLPVNMVFWPDDPMLARYKMYPGDLVMSLTGTVGKDDYGNVCILSDEYSEYYLNQRNAKLAIKATLNKHYLSEMLKFSKIKKRLTGISRGVRQANISNKDILALCVPIPPITLQEQFAAFVEQTDKSKVVVQKALDEAQTLFDSLMQEYFG